MTLASLLFGTMITTGAVSHHFYVDSELIERGVEINEVHPMLAVELDNGWSAGYYLNSYSDHTYFVGRSFRTQLNDNWQFTRHIGVNHGYRGCPRYAEDNDKTFCIQAWAGIGYTRYKFQPHLRLTFNAVLLSFEYKL